MNSVIRIAHNRENPYVQLNKQALWNENLSLKAIGLWARCMSRPDDWRFNVSELSKTGVEGRRAIYSAIDELIEQGYALRLEHYEKKEDGRFTGGGVEYVFFEFPPTQEEKDRYQEEFKKSFRQCGFGNCHDGDSRSAPLLKKEEEPKINMKEQQHAAVFFDDPDKISESLMQGGLSKEKTVVALEIWKKYKEEIKKRSDNPTGYLIWMVKKEINPFKAIEVKKEKIEKRKEWAYKNERTACAGGATATPEGYEVISGSIANFYRYDENSEFWNERQL